MGKGGCEKAKIKESIGGRHEGDREQQARPLQSTYLGKKKTNAICHRAEWEAPDSSVASLGLVSVCTDEQQSR